VTLSGDDRPGVTHTLLSAVAVGIAAREFAARHLDDCAMLRVLGLSQRRIAGAYLLEFGLLGLGASVAGVLLGLLVWWALRPSRRPAGSATMAG
jgi:putative ABC transport system permease protein